MKNSIQCEGYRNAYGTTNTSYTFWHDDGVQVTLRAGEDGVTQKHIRMIKQGQ